MLKWIWTVAAVVVLGGVGLIIAGPFGALVAIGLVIVVASKFRKRRR